MRILTDPIRAEAEFAALLSAVKTEREAATPLPLLVNGPSGGGGVALVAEFVRACPGVHLVLVPDDPTAARLAAFLSAAGLAAAHYPMRDFVLHPITASHGLERERLFVLHSLLAGRLQAVVATPAAALQATMPEAVLSAASLTLSRGGVCDPATLAGQLSGMGYSRVDMVEGAGQFACRGGIFDLWPAGEGAPLRFELFGDEIDRMGYFDPMTQRATTPCDTLTLLPAREVPVGEGERAKLIRTVTKLKEKASDEGRKTLTAELAAIEGGLDVPFADKYISEIYPTPGRLVSYVGRAGRPHILLLGTSAVKDSLKAALSLAAASVMPLLEAGAFPPKGGDFFGPEGLFEAALSSAVTLHINAFSGTAGIGRTGGLFGFRLRAGVSYEGREDLLLEDVGQFLSSGYRVLVACTTRAEEEAVACRMREAGYAVMPLSRDGEFCRLATQNGIVYTTHMPGPCPGGYDLPTSRVACLSTHPTEEKTRAARRRTRKTGHTAGERLLSYADLQVGDYVVHAVHGIGYFEGMTTLTVDGATRDYITVRYAGTDKLFLPADRLEMITKYIGTKEDSTVKLSRMGGAEWGRATGRAKAAARDMAKELIHLYAARARRPGHAFSPDDAMQAEFEAAFPYEETDGQLTACEEIKRDMEKPVPMDRLLCGDVGYGKTEVALRAAFKAVSDGKQVAILVPTTILAMQHYETALSRLRGFPVTVEMLSRFRTPKQVEVILRRLRRGEIDILVGTHKLLSKKLEFRDLGLLIVDEEQRFGVAQKEKLKEMAGNVDVLTLSSTPIPRTLNMAMNGIRDMSLLDEAPGDRHPVETYVMEHDDLMIEEAIRREIRRGGQVIYLYNRVETMPRVLAKLEKALPNARITAAHGQMDRETLEEIWGMLVRGEIDVILCTTIVETGVDLPNANTLIIEDADRMGLSQLHQIRGRVGRSGRQAYAYFTYRPGKALSDIATKRLSAIKEYAAFGAGFKIALRDLEIRGAGNLLGAEQHGHIEAVGYELYVRLLSEAVLEEQGKKPAPKFESQIDLRVDAHIPEGYVASPPARMELYKKISAIETEEDAADIRAEMADRYGKPPKPVERLLTVATVRALCVRHRISRVDSTGSEVRFFMPEVDLSTWAVLFSERRDLKFTKSTPPCVGCKLSGGGEAVAIAAEILARFDTVKREDDENNA